VEKKEAHTTAEALKTETGASASSARPTSQKIRSMLDAHDEPSRELKEKAGTDTNPTEVMSQLPDTPQEEPTPKKLKSAAPESTDDEWVEIDKDSIPKKAMVEEVEDEDDKPKH
jgi:hypothetical protein